MFGKSQSETADSHRDSASVQRMPRSAAASSAASEASSISSGLSIVGKIVGDGALTIFGHVKGELRASTVVIAEGAQIEGEVSAEELTIGGYVKGTIHANRVKLDDSARGSVACMSEVMVHCGLNAVTRRRYCERDAGWFVRLLFADAPRVCEGLFDRVEAGEYGKITQFGSSRYNHLAHAGNPVDRKAVHDHNVATLKCRKKTYLEID